MAPKSFQFSDSFYSYLTQNWLRESPALQALREETASHERAQMQISPEQGQFMGLLVQLIGVRRYLEVGVFTGYSSTAVALACPECTITALDVSEEFTAIARRHWTAAGVADRIDLKLAPALESMTGLQPGYDLMFIDADKTNYDAYYEEGLKLVRPGGVILIDNVFWSGKISDPSVDDDDTNALRNLNAKLHRDQRIDLAILPIGDGLTMARVR